MFRTTIMPTVDDHLAVDPRRVQRSFVSFFIVAISVAGLLSAFDDMRASQWFEFFLTVGVCLCLSLLAFPAAWLLRPVLKIWLAWHLRRHRGIGTPWETVFAADGIVLEEVAGEPGQDVLSTRYPWSKFLAAEFDDVRYLFWIEPRRAIVVHRDAIAKIVPETEFRHYVARWSGLPVVTPAVFAKNRRRRNARVGDEAKKPPAPSA